MEPQSPRSIKKNIKQLRRELKQMNPDEDYQAYQDKMQEINRQYRYWQEAQYGIQATPFARRNWKGIASLVALIGFGFSAWLYNAVGGDPSGDQGIGREEWIAMLSLLAWGIVLAAFVSWYHKKRNQA